MSVRSVRRLTAHWPPLVVFAFLLLTGALAFDDYGHWIDTSLQRAIGNAALDYLAGDGERVFEGLLRQDRYYGAAVEAPFVLAERLIGTENDWNIHLGRRALLHVFFLAGGGAFCYLLVHRLFGSRGLALVAMILFLLHPRVYGYSFFNSKDIPFLVAFMIALYCVHRAFRRDTLASFLLCGVGVGLLVNLRIMGGILFVAVLALRALDLPLAGSAEARKRVLLTGGAFALTALLTYYGSLPVLWTDPFGRFGELLGTLNDHPTTEFNLFRGEWLYSPDGPPFDYVPVWVGITTPPVTLLLALLGGVALAWRALRRPRDILRNGPLRFGLLLAVLPVATMAAVVVFETNVYDHWRQLYFLYTPLLLLAALGLHGITALASGPWLRLGTYALAGAAIAVTFVSLVRVHPYQPNYFNVLTDRTTPERLKSLYHLNTWDMSLRTTLVDIADEHPSGRLFVSPASPFTGRQRGALPPGVGDRIIVTRDFRSGERNFLELATFQPCPASLPAVTHVARLYAVTIHCVVDPLAWFGDLQRGTRTADPLVRSVYDIHHDGRRLTYVREGCPPDDVEEDGPRIFLHVISLDPNALYGWGAQSNRPFDNLDYALRVGMARVDGDCVASVVLPDYPIAGIRTGQFIDDSVFWEATVVFGEGAPDYAIARREALAGEPLARSGYDIHLAGRELTYVREGCTDADADARFFLHVIPADEDDLPVHRREHGFDNLDFMLVTHGARLDGDCVAVARLPAYPIATVRTGQYDDTGALWLAEFALPDGE